MPSPASVQNSMKSLPRSIRRATRSRGSNWPRFSNLSRLEADSSRTLASSARTSARRSAMRAALAAKAGEAVSIRDAMTGISPPSARRA
jgi:hypothetical protein